MAATEDHGMEMGASRTNQRPRLDDGPRFRATVVIATYNRLESLGRLLRQLGEQTLPPAQFEVVAVDDGSTVPVAAALRDRSFPFALRVETQRNAGASAARHCGAGAAGGEVLIFVDDDMQVGRGFVEGHVAAHVAGRRCLVLGRVRPPEQPGRMTLPERWHQHHLDRLADRARRGERLPGSVLYSGNVSMRREDYFEVGGFDPSLSEMEDRELGVRLEEAGFETRLVDAGYTVNSADEISPERWRRRVRLFGRNDLRIGRKHPAVREANPWRLLEARSRPLQLLFLGAAVFPRLAGLGASLGYAVASQADRLGATRLAFLLVGLVFGLEYYRGVREELGTARAVLADARDHLSGSASVAPGLRRLVGWLAPWPRRRGDSPLERDPGRGHVARGQVEPGSPAPPEKR